MEMDETRFDTFDLDPDRIIKIYLNNSAFPYKSISVEVDYFHSI